MISASDVPACPACGSREVHPVTKRADDPVLAHTTSLQMFYACRGCGRDQTDAWEDVEPKPKMKALTPQAAAKRFDELNPPPDKETIAEAALRLGICAELKT